MPERFATAKSDVGKIFSTTDKLATVEAAVTALSSANEDQRFLIPGKLDPTSLENLI
ncbi:MAG: hypothetical protein ACERKY_11840 [Anaerolineales bacterium]